MKTLVGTNSYNFDRFVYQSERIKKRSSIQENQTIGDGNRRESVNLLLQSPSCRPVPLHRLINRLGGKLNQEYEFFPFYNFLCTCV